MRCGNCNRFVSMDMADPAVDSIEVDADGNVEARISIVRTCAECGDELKEATLDLVELIEPPPEDQAQGEDGHELEVEETGVDAIEKGGGRYQKSFFGAEVAFTVKCNCGCGFEKEGSFSDEVAASEMEELA